MEVGKVGKREEKEAKKKEVRGRDGEREKKLREDEGEEKEKESISHNFIQSKFTSIGKQIALKKDSQLNPRTTPIY